MSRNSTSGRLPQDLLDRLRGAARLIHSANALVLLKQIAKLCAYGRFIIDHQNAPLITHVYPLSNVLGSNVLIA